MLTSLSGNVSQEIIDDIQLTICNTRGQNSPESGTNASLNQFPNLATQSEMMDVTTCAPMDPFGLTSGIGPETTMSENEMPQETSLTAAQRNYLINKVMLATKRKFATFFRCPIDPDDPDNAKLIDIVEHPMDLGSIATKLLDDKYASAQAFVDDTQLIVDNAKRRHGLNSSIAGSANELLVFVNKFMVKLPAAETRPPDDGSVGSGLIRRKRKATEDVEEPAAKRQTQSRPNGVSAQGWKEQVYLEKQLKAYRSGNISYEGKKVRKLVAGKVHEGKRREKVAEEKKQEKAKGQTKAIEAATSRMPPDVEAQANGGNAETSEQVAEDDEENQDGEKEEVIITRTEQMNQDDAKVILTSTHQMKSYSERLEDLSTDFPTQEEMDRLQFSGSRGPNFLGRTASLGRGWNFGQYHKKTNGFTAQDLLLPSADTRDETHCSHAHLSDLTKGEHVYVGGNHWVWKDLRGDELLSYSKDPLFLIVHALRRHHEKQTNVTMQFLDRRKAKSRNGEQAMFFGALDYYTIFEIPKSQIWDDWAHTKLHPRKFTQEYLTHGPVLYSDDVLKQARIEDLIEDGLYEIFPPFHCPENHTRAGLYTLQVVYRKMGYPPMPHPPQASLDRIMPIYSYNNCALVVPMTTKLLETVRKVTLNFRRIPDGADPAAYEPPLHAFVSFLTFEKRRTGDPVLTAWIKDHYTSTS